MTTNNEVKARNVAEAVRIVGSAKKVGQLYSPPISHQAVSKWIRRGCVPASRVRKLSEASGMPRWALNASFAE